MDPNKYKQNENIRPESLLKTIASVTSMLLMVLGIVGIALEFKFKIQIKLTLLKMNKRRNQLGDRGGSPRGVDFGGNEHFDFDDA